MVKKAGSLVLLLLLTGCATHLTEAGRKIKVVSNGDPARFRNCERLDRVRGETATFLSSGDYGVIYATNDARNKAGRIPRADTLEIISDGPQRFGGEVAGIVYNCLTPRQMEQSPAPSVPPPIREAPRRPAPARISPRNDYGVVFEKAKKCQDKGGVWVNDTCVLQID